VHRPATEEAQQPSEETQTQSAIGDITQVRSVLPSDHVLGNPNADIVFYVYSDYACPYCNEYHKTLKTLINFYGEEGEVAYVFRHMPFVELHPNAPMYALGGECVAEVGGNVAFWKYTDTVFETLDPIDPFTAEDLVRIADESGANKQSFVACMRSNALMEEVERDFDEAIQAGSKGTPFTIAETPTERTVYRGAQPLKALAYVLQTAVRQINTNKGETYQFDEERTIRPEDFNVEFDTSTSSRGTTSSGSLLDGIIES
jgi:protein-disulfide isomerase